jgi:aspartate/methionine/tyrosine aminotransferase
MPRTPFQPFAIEQYMSENEHAVEYHFAESGVHPLTYAELFELANINTDSLFATLVDYPQVNGIQSLREKIATMYDGTTAENILVTIGASEANTLVAATMLNPGDNMVRFRPTYEQLSGNASNLGIEVRTVDMIESNDWALDTDALKQAVDDRTRIIHVVNPNNPTGCILSQSDRDAVIAVAASCGAWIVADEVYAGTERDSDVPTASFWGDYDRVIAINSMSKAYGLPGLRLGWLVAPMPVIEDCWRRHEYATIAATMFSMKLADAALEECAREKLRARARLLIRRGFETFTAALNEHPGVFSVVPPQASAMSFVKFDLPVKSAEFARRLLKEEDVLIIPGSRFGVEDHFRFSSALLEDHLKAGLIRFNSLVGRILGE